MNIVLLQFNDLHSLFCITSGEGGVTRNPILLRLCKLPNGIADNFYLAAEFFLYSGLGDYHCEGATQRSYIKSDKPHLPPRGDLTLAYL